MLDKRENLSEIDRTFSVDYDIIAETDCEKSN